MLREFIFKTLINLEILPFFLKELFYEISYNLVRPITVT